MAKGNSKSSKLQKLLGLSDIGREDLSESTLAFVRTVVSLNPMAHVFSDSDQLYIESNESFAQLLQIPFVLSGSLLNESLAGNPQLLNLFEQTVADNLEYRSRLVFMERDDRFLQLLVDSKQVMGEGGSLGWLFVCREIDNYGTMGSEFLRNERLVTVGKMAAGIAHEIRNPLTTIRGFLQLLQQDWDHQYMEREKNFADMMLVEIERVNQLVNQLLLLSKPTDMVQDTFDLNDIVREVGALYQSEALLKSVKMMHRLQPVPLVRVNRNMFKQVLYNLSQNALDAMEEGGELTLSTSYDEVENKVIVDVADTGPGIPWYFVDRIFDAFFTTKKQGTGLGLAICQRIVHEFGGNIRVNSKGYGTTFSIMLPPWSKE